MRTHIPHTLPTRVARYVPPLPLGEIGGYLNGNSWLFLGTIKNNFQEGWPYIIIMCHSKKNSRKNFEIF